MHSSVNPLAFGLAGAALAALLPGMPPAVASHINFTTVALTGEAAPGAGGGVFAAFEQPVLNASGDLAFTATLQIGTGGVTLDNDAGIWTTSGGAPRELALLVREGDAAAGTGGAVFTSFGLITSDPKVLINDRGDVVFQGAVRGAGVTFFDDHGLWVGFGGAGGPVALIAREGDDAPGAPGAQFSIPGQPGLNATDAAFASGLVRNGAPDGVGVWASSGGVLGLVAKVGDVAPGMGGQAFTEINIARPAFNGAGDVIFAGSTLSTSPPIPLNGVWRTVGGSLQLVARDGIEAPGTGGAQFSRFFARTALNDAGDLAFDASIQSATLPIDDSNDQGVWASIGGVNSLIAREGFDAPGAGGADFDRFDRIAMNAQGHIVIQATLQRDENGVNLDNDDGLWTTAPDGVLRLLGRGGDPAPGMIAHHYQFPWLPAINASGEHVFIASLKTGQDGVTVANDNGLWLHRSAGGETTLLLREGDFFDVDNDPAGEDLRTISAFRLAAGSGLQDGRGAGFNDDGLIALELWFTDSSKAIVTIATRPCLCELDGDDAQVDVFDLLAYLDYWFALDPRAELDGDPAQVDVFDLLAYLDCWFVASVGPCR